MNNPLVSIIIPAYNHEKYIAQCIEGAINQTYRNIELIILDDGSKDNTFNVIKSYKNKCDSRFVNFIFKKKTNEGICKTLNEGIRLSNGDFVCTIASDDFFLPEKISKQIDIFKQDSEVMMCWTNGYDFLDGDLNNKKIFNREYPMWMKTHSEIFRRILINGNGFNNASCMYRKELFDYIGYFDEKLNFEDWDFYLRIAYRYKIQYIHEPLVMKREHGNNTSGKACFMFEGDKQILDKAFKKFKIKDKDKVKKLAYSNMYCWNMIRFFTSKNKENYRYCLKNAIHNNIFNKTIYKFFIKRALGIVK
ncbi:glycosyltransferase family 2 protein [Clostridium felsineum]|uniref:Chondroitin synthase n=1 Tax=Clostridium felsineum TaxID=36839 RepID=A0A1S8LWF2_9CLOT|nr:glycosyltransferase [Clostridium felsineum]URZ08143.1 Chondroitin synthase [Clostridium felsineum]URZ13174.1 Chondroitin synthase [Clostridium felsineum]